jgi:hypothetical protein
MEWIIHKVLSSLAGKPESFMKSVNLQFLDILVSFGVVSLFSNVPVDEVLQVISNKLHNDDTLVELSVLQAEAIMELLEVCLRTKYFQVDGQFFHQKDEMAWLWELSITNH